MPSAIRWLIDGYNVIFQSGFVGRARGPGWLERGRDRMLKAISLQFAPDERSATVVVFDASSPSKLAEESVEQQLDSGLTVRFATDHAEADDLLEELIRSHPHPKTLTVVSSDHRIQRCARAKRAKIFTADEFLDLLESPHQKRPAANAAPVERNLSIDDIEINDEDVDFWLREFDSHSEKNGDQTNND